jgi:toluene monooxygenase electron transfer component
MSETHFMVRIDGGEQRYACHAGDTLLRAGLRAGIGLSYECNAGSCGTCKIELVSGELDDLYPQAPGIKQRDRDRGRRLACQSVPRGDCTIKTRIADLYVTPHRPRRMAARLDNVRDITHDIREFSFVSDAPAQFLSGQYAMLSLAGTRAPRAYSMSNTANDGGLWQFMVRRTPAGVVSNALFNLPAGTVVEIDAPFGLAYLRENSERDIVCIAGGSGIAPMVSILDAAADHEHARHLGAWLFYGGRGPKDVPAVSQVLKRHHLGRRLEWHPVVSVPALADGTDWCGELGFVHELLPRKLPRPLPEYEYYFAGPPPMIEATIRLLVAENKVPASQLHFDRFF